MYKPTGEREEGAAQINADPIARSIAAIVYNPASDFQSIVETSVSGIAAKAMETTM